jgi:hypothetical protein
MTGAPRKISTHQMNCPPFAAMYAAGPVLGPEAEYARFAAESKDSGGSVRKDRIAAAMQATLNLRTAANQRFARLPDVLEDEPSG